MHFYRQNFLLKKGKFGIHVTEMAIRLHFLDYPGCGLQTNTFLIKPLLNPYYYWAWLKMYQFSRGGVTFSTFFVISFGNPFPTCSFSVLAIYPGLLV